MTIAKQTTRGIVDGKEVDRMPSMDEMKAGAQTVLSFPADRSPLPGFAMVYSYVPLGG
jgi:hypothetical protein